MPNSDWAIFESYLAKEAQMIGNFLGYFEKPHSYVKTALATFWATFGKNWATFSPTSGQSGSIHNVDRKTP